LGEEGKRQVVKGPRMSHFQEFRELEVPVPNCKTGCGHGGGTGLNAFQSLFDI